MSSHGRAPRRKAPVIDSGKVLIVDDEPANRDLLEAMIALMGLCPVVAANGPEGLAEVERGCDLVLLDVMMPGMDGFEVARRIRGQESSRLLPIVMVTSLQSTQDRVRALEAGADDFLTKPVDEIELNARVRSLLEKGRLYKELSRQMRLIEEQNRVMRRDLEVARAVQRVLIPRRGVGRAGLDIAFVYEPATQVGGDVLEVGAFADGRSLLFVGDAMGHGVQAALVMAVVKMALRSSARDSTGPVDLLHRLNQEIAGLFDEHFVTAVCCALDGVTGVAEVALAGHMGPVWRHAGDGRVDRLPEGSVPLGVCPEPGYESLPLHLAAKDSLLFCTDGIVESTSPAGEPFGYQRLSGCMAQHGDAPPQDTLNRLRQALDAHRMDNPVNDDLTLLCVQRRAGDTIAAATPLAPGPG